MALFKVVFTERAEKGLLGIRDKTISKRLFRKIESLAYEPRPVATRKIVGSDLDYRIRMGDYRVVYQIIDQEKKVRIVAVGHRKDIYRDR